VADAAEVKLRKKITKKKKKFVDAVVGFDSKNLYEKMIEKKKQ
jgi:hypothetical protein